MKILLKSILIFILLVFTLRVLSPFAVTYYLNNRLNNILNEYIVALDDVNLNFIESKYDIINFSIRRKGKEHRYPYLFRTKKIELDLNGKKLLNKIIMGHVVIHYPKIQIVNKAKDKDDQLGQKESKSTWREALKTLIPIKVESLKIKNGSIDYNDLEVHPDDAFNISHIDFIIKRIYSHEPDVRSPLFLTATVEQTGKLEMNGSYNYLSQFPQFDLNYKITGLELPKLNNVLYKYIPIDFKKGVASFYGEYIEKEKYKRGYIKLFIEKLDAISKDDKYIKEDHLFNELIVAITDFVLQNPISNKTATKIPFKTKDGKFVIDTSEAIWSSIENLFFTLDPKIDKSLSL